MSSISRLYNLLTLPSPTDPSTSFASKTIIVTGSNTGLGFSAALKFASLNARTVILAVRDLSKGLHARTLIEARTKRTGCVHVWQLDMNDYGSIRAFAKRASTELERVDVVVLNAGVFVPRYERSRYGWEETLQVNVLGTVLLALLLMPKLRASRTHDYTPSLELVSSGMHARVELTDQEKSAENVLEAINQPASYAANRQYGLSKLFLMYAMHGILPLVTGKKGGEPEVFITATCPGPCKSDLARGYTSWYMRILKAILFALFFRTTEQGARTLVSGASLGREGHGRFWQHDEFQPPAKLLTGEEGERLQKKVWHEIVDALRKDVPEVLELMKLPGGPQ